MPYETRRISLSEDELFHAVDLFRRDHPLELPVGDLVGVRIHEGHIEATLRPARDSPVRSVATFAPVMAVRALVHFCLDEEIPLPRHSDKTFYIDNDRATLLIELVSGRAAEAAHLIAEHDHRHGHPDGLTKTEDPSKALTDLMIKIETRTEEPVT